MTPFTMSANNPLYEINERDDQDHEHVNIVVVGDGTISLPSIIDSNTNNESQNTVQPQDEAHTQDSDIIQPQDEVSTSTTNIHAPINERMSSSDSPNPVEHVRVGSNNLPPHRASAFSSSGSSTGGLPYPHMPSFLADKEWTGTYGHHVAVRNKRSLYSRVFYPPMRRRNQRNEGLSPPVFLAIFCAGLMLLIVGVLVKTLV